MAPGGYRSVRDEDEIPGLTGGVDVCFPARVLFGGILSAVCGVLPMVVATASHARFSLARAVFLVGAALGAAVGVAAGRDPDRVDVGRIVADFRGSACGAATCALVLAFAPYDIQLYGAPMLCSIGALIGLLAIDGVSPQSHATARDRTDAV